MFGDLKRTRLIAYSAAFVGLIALGSWISIPFFPVPVTLQTLFVLLAAAVMKRNAVIPVTLFVLLGSLGLPVFHNGVAGIGVLLGPTGGYLIGFIPAAFLTGLAYEQTRMTIRVLGIIAGTIVIYIFGLSWLMYSTGMSLIPAVTVGMLPFLAGDAIKAFAAYQIAERLP
ncbi:MAG: biotin transporter BioY [Methanoregula sp.]|nr:MAG: biotin transporter BioY [Methanoregula sp.]